MAKLLKILGRIVGGIFEWSLILLIVLAFVIRTSAVQTYFAHIVTDYLSDELHAKVKVDEVAIVFFDEVALDGVLIEDQNGDTLVSAKRILVNLDDISFKKKSYTIAEARLREGLIHVQRDKDSVFNYAFIRDYFVKEKKEKSNVKVKLRYAEISDVEFRYDDNTKDKRTQGMDYYHLDAKRISGKVSDLNIEKDTITGRIEGLTAIEKCGFQLNCLTTNAKVSPLGVELSNVEIVTKDSWIQSAKFNMVSKTYRSFLYFVDSVRFDGQIDASDVSLKEVAYFAYTLEGMNDHVRVKSKIKNKVTQLSLKDFELKFKEKTYIRGNLKLPNYRNIENAFYDENLKDVFVDLEELKQLRLPNNASQQYISLSEEIERLKYIDGDGITLIGGVGSPGAEFVVSAGKISTALGHAEMKYGMKFKMDQSEAFYHFSPPDGYEQDFTVHDFNLGAYLANSDVGKIDGSFHFAGEIYSSKDIRFSSISGDINLFEYLNYPYKNIEIREGKFIHDRFEGLITVNDDFLKLNYKGYMDFNGENEMNFTVGISKADLQRLHFSTEHADLLSEMKVEISGKNINKYHGKISFDKFAYTYNNRTFEMDSFKLEIARNINGTGNDKFAISGSPGTAVLQGKVNLEQLSNSFNYQFSRIFPALYGESAGKYTASEIDSFSYRADFRKPNNFVKLFYPELDIAPGTHVDGNYSGKDARFKLYVESDSITYKGVKFSGLKLNQIFDSQEILANYHIDVLDYSDSLKFNDIYFNTSGGNNQLNHRLSWEGNTKRASELSWDTEIHDTDHFGFMLNPSHFYIKGHQWDISRQSSMAVKGDTISVEHFELTRNEQKIVVNGQISNNDNHKLRFDVTNLQMEEISPFITSSYPMTGLINLDGAISNPFNNFDFNGKGTLKNFYVNERKVGDISVKSNWNPRKKSIVTSGDLSYADEKTFDFKGDYYLFRDGENLDFDLDFNYTNLEFTNAFMDPDVVSEIRGFIVGQLNLTGTPTKPILEGEAAIRSGSALIDILGVHIGVDGPIEVDEYGFYINGIPVFDEDGNSGLLIGSVFHDNFENFNFDLQFDLEPQLMASNSTIFGPTEFSRFLVMDLPYDHDALYYGKGYVTGYANIFGYTENLEITTDFKTEKGTKLNIPMYGVGEIDEDQWIRFKEELSDTAIALDVPLFDLNGVLLDLNFEVTRDADINIIFNEEIGDIISANGFGDISITYDNQGDVRMEGTFEVSKGVYNFAMEPINNTIAVKQPFTIEEGGTISWTGDPYEAKLDLRTYYQSNANLSEITGASEFGSGGGAHQPVYSYLLLTGNMEEPIIEFDIQAPLADDEGRTLIDRIKSDPDELNRQFFSLLLSKRFQPIAGSTNRNGSGALDLLANQVNVLLAQISKEYRLNVDVDNDAISGDNTYEFGVSKGFLNDRLILSGSFGVENYGQEKTNADGEISTGQLIGDINLEYLLNQTGTFRVNIFNESTDKTILQEGDDSDFTQGAGLSYKEDFDSMDDFKLVQYVLDIFRRKGNKRYPNKGKRQQRSVPVQDIIKPEDSTTP